MSRQHMRCSSGRRRCTPALLATVAALAALSCGEYPVSNPLDPAYAVELTIQGPDTLDAFGEQVGLTYAAAPATTFPAASVRWTSSDPRVLGVSALGVMSAATAEVEPVTETVTLTIGGHTTSRQVTVWQRPARVELSSDRTQGDSLLMDGFGRLPILVRVLDPGNTAINTPHGLLVSDTAVLRIQGSDAFAVGPGRAYVIATHDALRDSLLVHVRQLPASVVVTPCDYPDDPGIRVGDSLLVAIAFVDGSGRRISPQPAVTGYRALPLGDAQPPDVILTPESYIKPLAAGVWQEAIDYRTDDGVTGELPGCIRSAGN